MKNKSINFANFVQVAHDVMIKEARQVENMASLLDENFQKAVEYILKSKGRVVITGIGKSALVSQKIVATLNSTGTPSVFMHTADAMHGDLGMVESSDDIEANTTSLWKNSSRSKPTAILSASRFQAGSWMGEGWGMVVKVKQTGLE